MTIILPTLVCFRAATILSMKVWPSMGRSALGLPMRLDSPAERTTATITTGPARYAWYKFPLSPPYDRAEGTLFQRGEDFLLRKISPVKKGDQGRFLGRSTV